jgi:hypothetical protein
MISSYLTFRTTNVCEYASLPPSPFSIPIQLNGGLKEDGKRLAQSVEEAQEEARISSPS